MLQRVAERQVDNSRIAVNLGRIGIAALVVGIGLLLFRSNCRLLAAA